MPGPDHSSPTHLFHAGTATTTQASLRDWNSTANRNVHDAWERGAVGSETRYSVAQERGIEQSTSVGDRGVGGSTERFAAREPNESGKPVGWGVDITTQRTSGVSAMRTCHNSDYSREGQLGFRQDCERVEDCEVNMSGGAFKLVAEEEDGEGEEEEDLLEMSLDLSDCTREVR